MSEKTWRALCTPDHIIKELRFIREFNLGTDQVMYRYTVSGSGDGIVSINDLCKHLGLRPVEGEKELRKAIRLVAFLQKEQPDLARAIDKKFAEDAPPVGTVKERELAIAKRKREIEKLKDINFLDEASNPPEDK